MSDDINEAPPVDPSVAFANWMIILTTVALIGAFLVVQSILGAQYSAGMFK